MEAQFSTTISRIGIGGLPLFVQKPKIAFLFLARNRLPLDLVWDQFFQVVTNFICLLFECIELYVCNEIESMFELLLSLNAVNCNYMGPSSLRGGLLLGCQNWLVV